MITLRFDLRSAEADEPLADLYAAAIEMCAWAETRGAASVILSEHHGADDNHLPSPLILASAIAARTRSIGITLAAVVLPFCDPVKLAEDMCVLDLISRGRAAHVLGIGHRREEYDHFGVDYGRRGRLADEKLALLLDLLKGQPVIREGHAIRIAPPPLTPGGPRLMIAGGSLAAARRAARHGLAFLAQANPPGLAEAYADACRAHGREPGLALFPDPSAPTTVFVAEDVDRAWAELGPYLLRDALMAASYRHGDDGVASISRAHTVEELRAGQGPYRIYSPAEAIEALHAGRSLPLHPLCGGVPPKLAWPYLEQAASALAQARGAG
jgi:alkanesulfonate monooxygenase SsuD/methylene tetrahydromethanopterin reductase-like flavin-dependent oxidoreductase (luciferase family)